ncbi:MAG: hypothetical protein HY923_10685 [Elusimicrobia bacterium]|nr:hypothetical protein [Elusimicrobiota bacterium]
MEAARPRLTSDVVAADSLAAQETDRLFSLYAAHYDAADRARFEADLAAKDHVILLRDAGSGRINGFSTQKLVRAGGARALFSGDTIIDPACWGEQELVKAWSRYAGRLLAEENSPLWWLLISKGHRTYLYLPLFFAEYWPRLEGPVPENVAALMGAFATAKFGEYWDASRGILSFPESMGQLTPALAEVTAGRKDDPRVSFFLEKNPGYARGEELVCLAEISPANMRSVAARALKEGLAMGPLPRQAACSI